MAGSAEKLASSGVVFATDVVAPLGDERVVDVAERCSGRSPVNCPGKVKAASASRTSASVGVFIGFRKQLLPSADWAETARGHASDKELSAARDPGGLQWGGSGDRPVEVRKRDVLAVIHRGVVIIEFFVVVIDAGFVEFLVECSGPEHERVLVLGAAVDVQAVE